MNVMGYVGKFDEATTAAYLREHKLGMAAVQQNVTYQRELLAGDTGDRAICVFTGVSMDLQTRKSCPLPAVLVGGARKLIRPYDI